MRAAGTEKCQDCSLFVLAQEWALSLTDGVDDWNPSHCGMPGREFLLVDRAQLAGYLLELVSSPLVWDAGIQ